MNGKEEEIYDILYKKKEINDKTPKLRTQDEKKNLKNLSYKISKIPKNLIDNITSGRGRLLGPASKSKMATMCVVCSV